MAPSDGSAAGETRYTSLGGAGDASPKADEPVTLQEPSNVVDAPVAIPNRRERRQKGVKLGQHHIRQWQAEAIKQKLFTPRKP